MLLENIKHHIIQTPEYASKFQENRVFENKARIFRALAETAPLAPHLLDLAQLWLQKLPGKPVASQTLRAIAPYVSTGAMPLHHAITCPWICPNSDAMVNAITVDIDHTDIEDKLDRLQMLGCPLPDIIQDVHSGRSHAVLFLKFPVVISGNGRSAPSKALDYATRLLAKALDGTPLKPSALVKSPWGRSDNLIGRRLFRSPHPHNEMAWNAYVESRTPLMWHTIPGTGACELKDIISTLAGEYKDTAFSNTYTDDRKRKKRGTPSALGRNCAVFDMTRWEAYDNRISDAAALHIIAERHNREMFAGNPLPQNELHAIARSIAGFMQSRFKPIYGHGAKIKRGRDGRFITDDMSTTQRQAIAGRQTTKEVLDKSKTTIKSAIERIYKTDGKYSISRMIELTKLSRPTLWRYRAFIGQYVYTYVSSAVLSGNGNPKGTTRDFVFPKFLPEKLSFDYCTKRWITQAERKRNMDELQKRLDEERSRRNMDKKTTDSKSTNVLGFGIKNPYKYLFGSLSS